MNRRIAVILLVCMMIFQMLPINASAEAQNNCSIEVQYRYQQSPLVGAEFDLYRIGSVATDGSLILSEPYASYPINTQWLYMGSSDISDLIYTYILVDKVTPVDTITIGKDGTGRRNVAEGLYLVAGRKYESDIGYFTVEPVIVPLPMKFSAEDEGERNVIINPKTRFTPKQTNTVTRSVMKVWNTLSEAEEHPEEITVCLLRDREEYERVTLSAENNWSYKWENLSASYEWRVAELNTPGYTVEVDLILGTFLMTNTKKVPEPEPEPEPEPDPNPTTSPTPSSPPSPTPTPAATPSPTPTPTATPETSPAVSPTPTVTPAPTSTPIPTTRPTYPSPSVPKLPQTGQLWLPIALALVIGILLLICGIMAILWDGKAKGIVMLIISVCLIAFGAYQLGCNIHSANHAGVAAEDTLHTIETVMPPQVIPAKQFTPDLLTLEELPENIPEVPYYVINPEIPMSEKNIDGIDYIGTLEIPDLELALPVASRWGEDTAKIAPCRYQGSAYTKDLIICAHNYKSHFGNLSGLSVGDSVILTDMDGNCFEYQVEDFEVMYGTAIEQMQQGDWDLTLFTCTPGGYSRFAVRCRQLF